MTLETIRFRGIVSVLPQASATSPRPDQQRGSLKTKRDATDPYDRLPKPDWIRVKAAIPSGRFRETKDIVRTHQLVTVCEEASCPNIGECWSKGTATFMIMGDDLRDGGAGHFVQCIQRIRTLAPRTLIEILTPDFGGRLDLALDILAAAPPDVLNHNIETVPRLYKEARPDGGAGRDRRRNSGGVGRAACPPRGHADHRAVPAAVRRPHAGAALCAS